MIDIYSTIDKLFRSTCLIIDKNYYTSFKICNSNTLQ